MCLISEKMKPKVAKEPIRCLKVALVVNGENMPYYMALSGIRYVVGEEVSISDEEIVMFLNAEWAYGGWKVNHGLHVFAEGSSYAGRLYRNSWYKCVVLECEIPVGARYYSGYSNVFLFNMRCEPGWTTERGYCAERLRVIRCLSEEEIDKL